MSEDTWSPELPNTNHSPSELIDACLELRKTRQKRAKRYDRALVEELEKVYELDFRIRDDRPAYEKALTDHGIKITKATPPFMATVKMLMEVDDKTAHVYAKALRRAEDAQVEINKITAYFKKSGGISGRKRKKEIPAAGHATRDDGGEDTSQEDAGGNKKSARLIRHLDVTTPSAFREQLRKIRDKGKRIEVSIRGFISKSGNVWLESINAA